MVKERLRNYIYLYLASFGVTLLLYWRLFFTFYQQDEWQAFGHFIALGWRAIGENLSFVDLILAKGRLLTVGIYDLIFTVEPYGVITIFSITLFLHALNGLLIYLLIQKLFRNKYVAIIATLFFLTNSIANQAVTWAGASIAIVGSTTCVLFSIFLLLDYVENNSMRSYIFSFILLFISLQFKESALVWIPLYIVVPLLFLKRKITQKYLLIAIVPLIYFVLFLSLRVGGSLTSAQKVGDYINSTHNVKQVVLANALTYTSTSFAQIIIPPEFIYPLAKWFFSTEYLSIVSNPQFDLLYQSFGADMINMFFSLIFLGILILCVTYTKEYKRFWLFLGMFLSTLLPYIIIQRGSSYLESRYYYLLLIPMSGFVGLILYALTKLKVKLYSIVVCMLIILIVSYICIVQKELKKQVSYAQARNTILHTLKEEVPRLKKNTVFFIQSDQSYVSLTNPLPFQEGIGYTFLAYLYNTDDKELNPLLIDNFLWDTGTQGFRKIGERGYGLFTEKTLLTKALREKQFTNKDVISFYWDSKSHKLINKTEK